MNKSKRSKVMLFWLTALKKSALFIQISYLQYSLGIHKCRRYWFVSAWKYKSIYLEIIVAIIRTTKMFLFFLAEIKPVHAIRPLFRFSRVLKRANLLGEDLMNDLSLQSTDDLQNFRFRLNGMPDSFRFRVADKRDKRERWSY